MSDKKIRLDTYLFNKLAQAVKSKGNNERNSICGQSKADKAGTYLIDSKVEIRGSSLKYISRGGLKLEKHFCSLVWI